MNRSGLPRYTPVSKASSTTVCQKCLQKDIYECTASVQARPYKPRPSRTQQLLNPNLKPKLASDSQNELQRKDGVASEQLAKLEQERGRKRQKLYDDAEVKTSRSLSSSSSTTNTTPDRAHPASSPENGLQTRTTGTQLNSRLRSPEPSTASSSGEDKVISKPDPAKVKRHHRQSREAHPLGPQDPLEEYRKRNSVENSSETRSPAHPPKRSDTREDIEPLRSRSLSPYSKRLALTQAINR